jgi:hypothetical protein
VDFSYLVSFSSVGGINISMLPVVRVCNPSESGTTAKNAAQGPLKGIEPTVQVNYRGQPLSCNCSSCIYR